MVAHGALRPPSAQRANLYNRGLAAQRSILHAGALEVTHRRGYQREAHATGDQAHLGMHLPGMLSDAGCKAECVAVTDDEVIQTGRDVAGRNDEALLCERPQVNGTTASYGRMSCWSRQHQLFALLALFL